MEDVDPSSVMPTLDANVGDVLPGAAAAPTSSASSRRAASSGSSPSLSRRPAGISRTSGSPTASRGWRTRTSVRVVVGQRADGALVVDDLALDLLAVGVAEALDRAA